ncbi:MAG: hypothetical protein EOO41_00640, partial [Methanobacteriota archaeon]
MSTLHAATVGSTPVPFSPEVVVGTEHTRSRVAGYSQPQHSFARPPTIVSRSLGTPVGTSPHTTARASPAHRPQLASVKCAGSHLGELLSCRLRVTTPRLEATSHCSHAGGFAFHGSGMSGRTPRWQAASTASPSAWAGKRVRLHTRMKGGVRDEALELHVADAAWDQQVRASTARVQLAAALHAMFTEASTLRNALYVMCSHLLLSQGAWLSAAWQQQSVPAHHPIIEAANSLGDTWLAASLNAVCGWEADALPSTEDAAQPLWIAADGSVQRAVFSMTSDNLEHTVKHVLLAGAADNHSAKMRAHGLLFQRLDYAYRHHATRGTCAAETAAYADHVTAARRTAAPSLCSVSGDHPLTSTHRNSGGVHTSCALRDPKHGPSAPDESTSTVGYTPAACAPSAAHKLGAVHKRRTSYWQARPTCTNSDAPKQESVEQADGIPTLSAVCAVCCAAATFEVEQPTSARGGGIRSAAWGGERVTALKSTAHSVRDEASPFPGCMPPIERKALEFAHEYAAEALPWLRTTRAADVLAFPRLQSTLIANPPTVRNMIHDHFGTFLEPLSTSCLQQTVHAPAPGTGGIGAAVDDPGASVALTPQLLETYTGAARPVHFFFIPQDVPSTFLGMPRLPQLIRTATRLVYRSAHAVWAQLQPHLPPSACDEAGPRLERPIAATAPALPDDVVQYVAATSRVWADLCAVSHSEGYGEQGGAVRDGVQRVRRGIMLNATLLLPMCYALLVSTSLCKSTVDAGACDDTLRMAATLAAHGSDHWIFRPITFSVQFTADTSMADMCLALWRRVNACFAVYYVQLLTAEGKHKCSRGPAMAAACAVAPAHPELGDSSLHTTAADECCAALLAPALGAPDGACAWDLSLVRNAQRGLRCRQGGAPLEHLFLTTYSSYRSMQQLANAFLQPLSGRPLCRMLGIAIDAASEAYTAEQLSAAHFAHKRRSSLQAAAVCPPPPAPVTPLGSLPSRSLEQTAPYLCQFIGCIMPPELTPRSHRDSNRVGSPPPAIAFDATQPDALLSLIALCLPPALECVPLDVSFSHDHFLRLMLASLLGYSIVFD